MKLSLQASVGSQPEGYCHILLCVYVFIPPPPPPPLSLQAGLNESVC